MHGWMVELFGLSDGLARGLSFAVALIFVLVLISLFFFVLKRLTGTQLPNSRSRHPRLAVMDATNIDARRRLLLVRRDNIEHLILIGGPSDIVVEQNIVKGAPLGKTKADNGVPIQASAPGYQNTPAEQDAEPEVDLTLRHTPQLAERQNRLASQTPFTATSRATSSATPRSRPAPSAAPTPKAPTAPAGGSTREKLEALTATARHRHEEITRKAQAAMKAKSAEQQPAPASETTAEPPASEAKPAPKPAVVAPARITPPSSGPAAKARTVFTNPTLGTAKPAQTPQTTPASPSASQTEATAEAAEASALAVAAASLTPTQETSADLPTETVVETPPQAEAVIAEAPPATEEISVAVESTEQPEKQQEQPAKPQPENQLATEMAKILDELGGQKNT